MKQMFAKIGIVALMTVAMAGCFGCASSASPFTQEDTYLLFESGEAPSSPGKSSVKTILHYEGKDYLLLPTFDDPQVAIRDFMLRYPETLQKMELANPFLGPLNTRNYGLYKDAAYGLMGAPGFEGEEGLMPLLSFIDILENEDDNKRILALAAAGDVEGVMMALPDQDALRGNLESER